MIKMLMWLFVLGITYAVVMATTGKKQRRRQPKPSHEDTPRKPVINLDAPWAYKQKSVLTAREQQLYYRLLNTYPELIVLTQVALSSVLDTTSYEYTWRNIIDKKSIDFVICKIDFSVVVAIELDDKTHERADRKYADTRKNKALETAGVPLVRWAAMPGVQQMDQELADAVLQNIRKR
jgi:hypothetical protein